MLRQIETLLRAELQNIFGWNVMLHTKDKKAKQKNLLLAITWVILITMMFFYVGGLAYGLILLRLEQVIPAYLITISSLIVFFFGIFKAGGVIFRRNGYDLLCSLPVKQSAIVISRFLRMYVENLLFTLAVLVPGLAVYVWFLRPGVLFYLIGILTILCVPLLPMTAAALIGAVVTGISSRMKHKSLVEAVLSIVIVLVVMFGTSSFSGMEGEITPEMMQELSSTVFVTLEKLYLPAVWLGEAVVTGDVLQCFLCIVLSLGAFLAVTALISANFQAICRRLYSTSAKHDYRLESLKRESILISLCKREFKRYFASSVYVSNTIMGPIMGTVLAIVISVMGMDSITELLGAVIDIGEFIPFVLAGTFGMMTTTSVSISMEGKNWWILKSLPLSMKNILDAKILMNLILMLPFYLVSEISLILALRPGFVEAFWLLAIPACIILFSCVFGITVNLQFPVMSWESEVSVVKQSASAMLGGMGGFVIAILCAASIAFVPKEYSDFMKLVICVITLMATALLYLKNNRNTCQDI